MELRQRVPVSRARSTEAWEVLTDLERIAPCMPGAQLQEVEGDEYRGIVKVKVGPITAQYKGVARFVEQDEARPTRCCKAEGRDTRGQGNATRLITANLGADGDAHQVTVNTDLTVTGKVAQFGRGVLADVSAKLLTSSSTCLEADVLDGRRGRAPARRLAEPAPAAPRRRRRVPHRRPRRAHGPRDRSAPSRRPVDLMGTAGAPVRQARRARRGLAVRHHVAAARRRRRRRGRG